MATRRTAVVARSASTSSKQPGRVVVITSGKGGVGKTTVTASMGYGLAQRGFRTCLIDFDIGLRNLDLHLVRTVCFIRRLNVGHNLLVGYIYIYIDPDVVKISPRAVNAV